MNKNLIFLNKGGKLYLPFLLFLFLFLLVLLPVTSAGLTIGLDTGRYNPIHIETPTPTLNYTTIETNSSIFWGTYIYTDYDMDLILSFAYNQTSASGGSYNATYNTWAYNQSTPVVDLFGGGWNSTYNATYDSYSAINSSQWTKTGGDIYYTNLTGKVGIGTTTPITNFEISHNGGGDYGMALFLNGSAIGNSDGIKIEFNKQMTTPKSWNIGILDGVDIDDFVIAEDGGHATGFGNPRLVIEAGGNIGIGTEDPAQLLHISTGETQDHLYPLELQNPYHDDSGTEYGVGIRFHLDDDNGNKWVGISGVLEGIYANDIGLAFYTQTNPATPPDEVMRINEDGEVDMIGVSGDGTGKVVCIKADGNLGTCSSVVASGGTCTCG